MEDDIFGISSISNIGFRDLLFAAFFVIFIFWVLIALLVNMPKEEEENDSVDIGSVVVHVVWPSKLDVDVDLWVKSPGDKRPVGYSNRSGKIFNLLRDDRGNTGDITEINYEVASSRGAPAGEYIINLHLYRRGYGVSLPLENIVVSATYRPSPQAEAIKIFKKVVVLSRDGKELTVMRFMLTHEGKVKPGSLHDIPIKIRSTKGDAQSWGQ